MAKVSYLILGGKEITERDLFESNPEFTATWPDKGEEITVELNFRSEADNEQFTAA